MVLFVNTVSIFMYMIFEVKHLNDQLQRSDQQSVELKEMKIMFLLYYSLNFISSTIMNLNLYVHALMFITCIKTSLTFKFQHGIRA